MVWFLPEELHGVRLLRCLTFPIETMILNNDYILYLWAATWFLLQFLLVSSWKMKKASHWESLWNSVHILFSCIASKWGRIKRPSSPPPPPLHLPFTCFSQLGRSVWTACLSSSAIACSGSEALGRLFLSVNSALSLRQFCQEQRRRWTAEAQLDHTIIIPFNAAVSYAFVPLRQDGSFTCKDKTYFPHTHIKITLELNFVVDKM